MKSAGFASGEMSYGLFAVALYASDMPTSARLPVSELLDYAAQGERTLHGRREVERLHRQWLALNRRLLSGEMTGAAYRAELAALWPDLRRLDRCVAADAERLMT